jgi:hypothetical protein
MSPMVLPVRLATLRIQIEATGIVIGGVRGIKAPPLRLRTNL